MKVNPNDKSGKDLCKVARKLGFNLVEGGNHTKVKMKNGEFVTTIPRHPSINRQLAIKILKQMKKKGAKIEIVR